MLYTAQILSLFTLEICGLILLVGTIRSFRVTKHFYLLVFMIAISVAVWGYSFDPNPGFDLYRLYKNIEAMQLGGWESNVLNNDGTYSGLYAFNALCYLVSLLGNYRWLSVISVFSVFAITLGVLISYFRSEGYSSRGLLISVAMIFAGMQLPYVFSGVRNSMAVSLTILSLYLFFYKKKFRVMALIMYLAACTIHPMVLIVLPALLLSNAKRQKPLRIVALFTVPTVFGCVELMRKIPIELFQNMASRLEMYQGQSYAYDRPEMIANSVFFILFGLTYWYLQKQGIISKFSKNHGKFENFYYLLGFAMIGSMVHRDFALRIGYIMGLLNIPMLCKILLSEHDTSHCTHRYCRFIGLLLLFVMVIIVVCMFKVYYDTIYTMRKMTFI